MRFPGRMMEGRGLAASSFCAFQHPLRHLDLLLSLAGHAAPTRWSLLRPSLSTVNVHYARVDVAWRPDGRRSGGCRCR